MKKILTIIAALMLWAIDLSAQKEIETKIDSVTVYVNGAIINRSAKITIGSGTTTYLLTGLSSELNKESLRVGINNQDVTIVSINHRLDTKENAEMKKKQSANDRRKSILKDSIAILNAKLGVIEEETELILGNNKIAGQNGLTAEQLDKMVQYFRRELTRLENEKMNNIKLQKKYTDEYKKLVQEANNSTKEISKMVSTVELVLKSDKEIHNVSLTLNYMISDASWTPYYEVKASENSTLRLGYNARVRQSSKEDWNNVKLTLSTGDPSISNTKPDFFTMFLPPVNRPKQYIKTQGKNLIYGHVVDSDGSYMIGCSVVEQGSTNGTVVDLDGYFKLELINPASMVTFSYIGYETQTLRGAQNMFVTLKEDQTALQDVVVVGYGSRNRRERTGSIAHMMEMEDEEAPLAYANTGSAPEKNIPMEISQNFTATEFRIDIPYTIKSDSKETDVNMLTYNINANCQYIAAPRFSNDVYFVAQIPECYKYSLLDGTANLYLDNIYQGETQITPDNSRDTLELSIGRDRSISISRKEIKNSTSKSFIGGTYKVLKTFETTVKNNKKTPVEITVEDQYPIAKYTDIKVSVVETDNAEVNQENGRLTWNISLAPGESKKIRLSYEVKYPKSYRFEVE